MAKFLDYDGLVHYTSCFKPTLVDLVDNGAKNLIPMTRDDIKAANPAYTWNGYTATVAGLSFTVNEDLSVTISGTTSTTPYELLLLPRSKGVSFLSNGDYVLSGGYSGTYETTLQVGVNRTSGGSGVRYATYIGTPVEFTVSDAPAANGVWIAVTNDSPGLQINATVKPMICTKSAWNISQKFVPYRPTYEETVEQVAENENNISSQQNTVAQGGNGYALINGIRQYTGDTVTPPVPPNSLWLKDSVKVKTDNYFNVDDFSAIQVDAQGNKRCGTNCGILSQGTYTLSATASTPQNNLFHTIKSGSTYTLVTIDSLPYTFTADGVSEQIICVANATTTSWAENGYANIMLNTGSTAESYTPYWTDVIDEKINPLENNILTLETMNGAKNLMHYDSIDDTRTTGTITATLNSDMTITINGTSGDTSAVIGFVFPLKSGEYWLNGCPTDGSLDTYSTDIRNQIYGSIIYGRDTGSGGTVNISDDGNYAYNIRIAANTVINNMIFKPMLISSDIKNAGFTNYQPYAMSNAELTAKEQANEDNILSIQQEQIVQNNEIATLRKIINCKLYGFKIDKQDVNPDTRVTYLYDAIGMTPAYMDFANGSFNYGSWVDIWFVKNNRPVALKFDGTVDYELSHTDFTKKIDGTASDVEDVSYAGNFMSEIPLVYVKRWEDERYNYIVFCETKPNDDYLAQAHTNANGTVNPYIYLPMFKGWKDSNNKLRSIMGTYPTGNTTGTNEVTYASNNGTGWQIWDKAKIDLIMDLIMLITKSTNCRAKIGNGDCQTYNASDTTNYGKMKSGYETDGTTRSASAQFYGSEGTDVTNYGKHHMIAFYIEDLWGNRWDRCLGFNLVDNVYKVKMTPPYVLDSDNTYQSLSATPPSSTEGWLKNVSSGVYGDVPTGVGASNTSGFANYFYKNASGARLSTFGGYCNLDLKVGRYWNLGYESGLSLWSIGGSPCFNSAT